MDLAAPSWSNWPETSRAARWHRENTPGPRPKTGTTLPARTPDRSKDEKDGSRENVGVQRPVGVQSMPLSELFIKALKQNLTVKSFVGTSENALRIQIRTAVCPSKPIRP